MGYGRSKPERHGPKVGLAGIGGNDPHSSAVTVPCASMNTLYPLVNVALKGAHTATTLSLSPHSAIYYINQWKPCAQVTIFRCRTTAS